MKINQLLYHWVYFTTTSRIQDQRPITNFPPLCSKHILNAQVAIRSSCCMPLSDLAILNLKLTFHLLGRKWFDCAECHQEQESHQLAKSSEMVWHQTP